MDFQTTEQQRTLRRPQTDQEWESHKNILHQLYIQEDRSPSEIVQYMKDHRGLCATKKQYENRFKKWEFRKNLEVAEWQAVDAKLKKRKRQGKDSDVYLSGVLLPQKKIRRGTMRYKPEVEVRDPSTPSGVVVCTPRSYEEQLEPTVTKRFLNLSRSLDHRKNHLACEIKGLAFLLMSEPDSSTNLPFLAFSRRLDTEVDLRFFANNQTLGGLSEIFSPRMIQSLHSNFPTIIAPSLNLMEIFKFSIYLLSNGIHDKNLGHSLVRFFMQPSILPYVTRLLRWDDLAVGAFAEKLLIYAVFDNTYSLVEAILNSGTEARPVHLVVATEREHIDLIRLLKSKGADPEAKPDWSAVHLRDWRYYSSQMSASQIAKNCKSAALKNAVLGFRVQESPESPESPESLEDYLLRAVYEKDTRLIDVLLVMGVNVNHCVDDPFIKEFPDISTKGRALTVASRQGDPQIVQMLLQYHAEVNVSDPGIYIEQNSPLEAAVWARVALGRSEGSAFLEVITTLLKANADPNTPAGVKPVDTSSLVGCSKTVLQVAVEAGDKQLMHLLLRYGANPNIQARENHGLTPFQAAFRSVDHSLWQILYDCNQSIAECHMAPCGFTALVGSIRAGNVEAAIHLVTQQADVDINFTGPNTHAGPPLSEAILMNEPEIMEILILKGADISNSMAQSYGCTPLQAAVFEGDISLVHRLMDLGADPCEPVALAVAVHEKRTEVTEILTDAACTRLTDTQRGQYGRLALALAIRQRCTPIIRRLVEMGTYLDMEGVKTLFPKSRFCPDCRYMRPGDEYYGMVRPGTAEYFAQIFQDRYAQTPLEAAIDIQDEEIVRFLLSKGADPLGSGYEKYKKQNPLLQAVTTGSVPVVLALLENMPDKAAQLEQYHIVSLCDPFKGSVLQLAADNEDIAMAELLLDHGADVNAKARGWTSHTALQAAAKTECIGLVKYLCDKGADVNALPAQGGATALESAAKNGRLDIVQFLLNKGAYLPQPGTHNSRRLLSFTIEAGHETILKLLKTRQSELYGQVANDENFGSADSYWDLRQKYEYHPKSEMDWENELLFEMDWEHESSSDNGSDAE